MAKIYTDKKYEKKYVPNDPQQVRDRVMEYECTKYCRICPYPGLKCCNAPVNDLHAK